MEKAAAAQAEGMERQAEANVLTEEGQRQERLRSAIEHLGRDSHVVRMAAAYELVNLAKDTAESRQTVLDILCAHIRQTTGGTEYQEEHNAHPSIEVQSLLTLLFVREHLTFSGLRIDLEGCWLKGSDLREARLWKANLREVRLTKARLQDACLCRATLTEARLKKAWLAGSCLREANLTCARMEGANLTGARLQGATVWGGRLATACFRRAHMQGADFMDSQMYGATLSQARLQAAFLDGANFQGAGAPGWPPEASFADRLKAAAGRESSLSTTAAQAVFSGGLTRERVKQIAESVLGEEERRNFWVQIKPDIDAVAHHEPRNDSRAVLGAYSATEGEAWIAEHEAAMSRVAGTHGAQRTQAGSS